MNEKENVAPELKTAVNSAKPSLLDSYKGKQAGYVAPVTEDVAVVINSIFGTRNEDRVGLNTSKGTFFAWKNSFPKGVVPVVSSPMKATLTLVQKGEFINVATVSYDIESLTGKGIAIAFGNAIQL